MIHPLADDFFVTCLVIARNLLLGDFQGYVEFFLLYDLVDNDCTAVNFFLPFDDFNSSAVPQNKSAYHDYRTAAVEFIVARNQRIHDWTANH